MKYDDFQKLLDKNNYTINDLPLTGKSENDEPIILTIAGYDNDDNVIWKTVTYQKNGYIRMNLYYFDGDVEELYEYE